MASSKNMEILQDDAAIDFADLMLPVYGYHLACLAAIAYYGDGKITKMEMQFILQKISSYLVPDTRDKEYKSKLILLDILDSLQSAMDEITDKDQRREVATEIVDVLSKKIIASAKADKRGNSWCKEIYKDFYSQYENIFAVEGKASDNNILSFVCFKPAPPLGKLGLAVSAILVALIAYFFWWFFNSLGAWVADWIGRH